MKDKDLFIIQKYISLIFIALLLILSFIKVIYFISTNQNLLNIEILIKSYIPIYFILIILFGISAKINSTKIRYMQVYLFLFQSYFSLFEALDSFLGWGLGIVAFNLAYRYHFFEKNFLRKLILIFIGFLICSGLSIKVNNFMAVEIIGQAIFFIFMALFIIIINIKDFNILLFEKTKKLNILNNFILFNSDYDEQLENNNLNNNKKLSIIQKKEKLDKIKISTEKKLRKNDKIKLLSSDEFEIISKFYFARGNITNQELAYSFNTTENIIKNRLRNIYKKLEVPTRTTLLAFLDDYLS